jgi:predicted nucleic acid-binding protein
MPFVLDASITLSWAFTDESEPAAARAAELLETGADTARVPDLWRYEVRNVLLTGERSGRISAAATDRFLGQISRLRIETDTSRDDSHLLQLARQHKLTVYDAAYLALALHEHIPLATLDRALSRAAAAEGITLLA